MTTLMELMDRIRELELYLESEDADLTPGGDVEQKVLAYLDRVEGAVEDKLDAYGHYLQQLERERDAAAENVRYWAARERSRDGRIRFLKGMLFTFMKATRQRRMKTDSFAFSVVANGGKLGLDLQMDAIPEEYWQPGPPVLDTDKLRADLEAGVQVEGARFKERGEHVRIS